jgi:hypothetical protein
VRQLFSIQPDGSASAVTSFDGEKEHAISHCSCPMEAASRSHVTPSTGRPLSSGFDGFVASVTQSL